MNFSLIQIYIFSPFKISKTSNFIIFNNISFGWSKKQIKKIFVIFIVFSLFISSLCIDGCKTEGDNDKCTTCNDGYLLVNDAACFYGCKTEDNTTKGKCATCNDGYTLSTDKTSCTAETKKEDDTKEDDKNSSFGLYSSLLIFALVLLF